MMKKFGLLIGLGVLSLVWGCSAVPKAEYIGHIKPGIGIDKLLLTEERDNVEKTWGNPDDIYENPFDKRNVIVAYHPKGVEISYRDGKVDCINLYPQGTDWQAYQGATSEGIWVNSNADEVRKMLGKPKEEAPRSLEYDGIAIFLKDDGKIDYLTVSLKDEDKGENPLTSSQSVGDSDIIPAFPEVVSESKSGETSIDDDFSSSAIENLRREADKIKAK